jgi:predicted ribosomally synthesized peptide with SipW-like signal peptide
MNGKVRALVGATGVSAVVAAVALSGGTSAFYYDSAHITNNKIASCGFGLSVASQTTKLASNASARPSAVMSGAQDPGLSQSTNTSSAPDTRAIDIEKYQPGDYFQSTYDVTNTNKTNCTADVWADISNHTNLNTAFATQLKVHLADADNPTMALTCTNKDRGSVTVPDEVTWSQLAIYLPCALDKALPGGETFHLVATYGMPLGGRGEHQEITKATASADGTDGTQLKFNVDFALVQQGVNVDGPL